MNTRPFRAVSTTNPVTGRVRWSVFDTVSRVSYNPPKGTRNPEKFVRNWVDELNNGK